MCVSSMQMNALYMPFFLLSDIQSKFDVIAINWIGLINVIIITYAYQAL